MRLLTGYKHIALLGLRNNPTGRNFDAIALTATAYPGEEKDYATVDKEIIRGPLVSVISKNGSVIEKGLLDRADDFVSRNMGTMAWGWKGPGDEKRRLFLWKPSGKPLSMPLLTATTPSL